MGGFSSYFIFGPASQQATIPRNVAYISPMVSSKKRDTVQTVDGD